SGTQARAQGAVSLKLMNYLAASCGVVHGFRRTLGSGGSLVSMITRTGLSWLSVPVSTIWYVGASGSSLMHPLPSGQVAVYRKGNRNLPCARSFQVPWRVCSCAPGLVAVPL